MTTKLFLHGVPETAAIWHDLIEALDGEATTLSLPGFATDLPAGFDGSMDSYAAWLTEQIVAVDDEVDLVGHDWGGILTARIATVPPANLRSWVTDAPGALRAGFVWHDLAKLWISDAGEDFWSGMIDDPAGSAELLTGFGLTLDHATQIVDGVDQRMVDSILRLYRSSTGLGVDWLITGPATVPGLVVIAADDPLGSVHVNREMAEQLGAGLAVLDSGGHFWPIEAAAAGAAAISGFWATLSSSTGAPDAGDR